MKKAQALLIAAFLVAGAATAAEKRPAAEQEKIDWLLSEMKRSDAVFIRNGKEYDGQKAAAHLKSKLWFAGRRVQTARDFIAAVASRSEETVKPYEIRSRDGKTKPLGKWLTERLATFENHR